MTMEFDLDYIKENIGKFEFLRVYFESYDEKYVEFIRINEEEFYMRFGNDKPENSIYKICDKCGVPIFKENYVCCDKTYYDRLTDDEVIREIEYLMTYEDLIKFDVKYLYSKYDMIYIQRFSNNHIHYVCVPNFMRFDEVFEDYQIADRYSDCLLEFSMRCQAIMDENRINYDEVYFVDDVDKVIKDINDRINDVLYWSNIRNIYAELMDILKYHRIDLKEIYVHG